MHANGDMAGSLPARPRYGGFQQSPANALATLVGTHHDIVEFDHLVRHGPWKRRRWPRQQHGETDDTLSALRHQHRRTGSCQPQLDLLARARRSLEAPEDIGPRLTMEFVELVEQRNQSVVVPHARTANEHRVEAHAANTSRSASVAKPKAW